jgi:integrase
VLDAGLVTITEAVSELRDGTRLIGDPKSWAGRRTVAIPPALLPELRDHVAHYAERGRDGVVFVGPLGGPLRRGNWWHTWKRATAAVGLDELRFHDLRHTGNTLAASTGASTKELMRRMGPSSARAALLYQHATQDRERAIAEKLSGMIDASSAAAGA